MNLYRKVISASLSPNTQPEDVLRALRMLFSPLSWVHGSSITDAEEWFRKTYPGTTVASFNSGRSALLAILKSFGIGAGDEVIVQSFTCVAVPNSVLWAGAKPVYADIDATLNLDIADAAKKITSKTRAVIVQHTLGIPADMGKIMSFAKKHRLLVIEDCAHSLGASFKGTMTGQFGDAAFFSFGRDKVISSVFGGLAIVKNRFGKEAERLKTYQQTLDYPSHFFIWQQLLHPVLFSVIVPLYTIGIGKLLLWVFQRMRLLSFPVFPEEKKGMMPHEFPRKYPNALAYLLLLQLNKITVLNRRRQKIAAYYEKVFADKNIQSVSGSAGSIYLRYSILVDNPQEILEKAKKSGILLGNWYHNVIDPGGVDFRAIGYAEGSCPKAENTARRILNLPTNISETDAQTVIKQII